MDWTAARHAVLPLSTMDESERAFSTLSSALNGVLCELTSIRYSFYLPAELRQLSVKRITNVTQRDALSRPMAGGLYDPALGPTDHFESCVTCGLDYSLCPGHFGHIDLALPAYNQLLFPLLYSLLRSKCLHCDRFRLGVERLGNCVDALSLLEAGMISEAALLLDAGVGAGGGGGGWRRARRARRAKRG